MYIAYDIYISHASEPARLEMIAACVRWYFKIHMFSRFLEFHITAFRALLSASIFNDSFWFSVLKYEILLLFDKDIARIIIFYRHRFDDHQRDLLFTRPPPSHSSSQCRILPWVSIIYACHDAYTRGAFSFYRAYFHHSEMIMANTTTRTMIYSFTPCLFVPASHARWRKASYSTRVARQSKIISFKRRWLQDGAEELS